MNLLFATPAVFALTLLLLGSSPVCADPFADPIIRDIQTRHDLAVAGDKELVIALCTELEQLTQQQPDRHLFKVYLGSVYTLRSRDLFPGPSKFSYLKNGLKVMDQAVDAAPTDLAVRFIRAVNNYNLPSFINRRDNARADFKQLLAAIRQPEVAATLNAETLQAIHYYAGLSYKQTNETAESRTIWSAGIALATDSPLAQKMREELDKLKKS